MIEVLPSGFSDNDADRVVVVVAPGDKFLLTIKEAAERLSMSERELYRVIKRGELPAVHIGRMVRVHTADVAAWAYTKRDQEANYGTA